MSVRPETYYAEEQYRYEDSIVEEDLKTEQLEDLIKFKTEEYLNDETLFEDLDARYEIVETSQILRAMCNLDRAIRRFNLLHGIVEAAAMNEMQRETAMQARRDIDAVFTALSNIQDNMLHAIKHEAEEEMK